MMCSVFFNFCTVTQERKSDTQIKTFIFGLKLRIYINEGCWNKTLKLWHSIYSQAILVVHIMPFQNKVMFDTTPECERCVFFFLRSNKNVLTCKRKADAAVRLHRCGCLPERKKASTFSSLALTRTSALTLVVTCDWGTIPCALYVNEKKPMRALMG